eukprot:jgi/Picre1/30310/NNA_005674.t1
MAEEGNTQDLLGSHAFNLPHSVEDEDSLLFQTDYDLLKKALMNEKASPEILPYQHDLLSRLYIRIDQQERIVSSYGSGVSQMDDDAAMMDGGISQELVRTMIAVELTRLRYMMRSYLRVRLFKIEKYAMHCVGESHVNARLSSLESAYVQEYVNLTLQHLRSHVTSKLPEAFSAVSKQATAHPHPDMIPTPDIGHHVFARVERTIGDVQMYDDGTTEDLVQGDLYIMRYKVIREFLQDGSVQLGTCITCDDQLREIIKALNATAEEKFLICELPRGNALFVKNDKVAYVKDLVKKYFESLHFDVDKQ